MKQGETVTAILANLPVKVEQIKEVYIIFKNSRRILLEKHLEDCVITGEVISCRLSQEETLNFTTGPVWRSVIFIAKDGARFETDPDVFMCEPTGKGVVL